MKKVVKSSRELTDLAKDFVSFAKKSHKKTSAFSVRLFGDLGAGKTSFVKEVASIFGVLDKVTSPTFVLQKIYCINDDVFDKLVHIDAYRIESKNEEKTLKLEEIINDPKAIIFVEWPENIKTVSFRNPLDIYIEHLDFSSRKFSFNNYE